MKKPRMITYQITIPQSVASAIAGRGANSSPHRSRKRQTEVELCKAEGVDLDSVVPLSKKGPKARTVRSAKS